MLGRFLMILVMTVALVACSSSDSDAPNGIVPVGQGGGTDIVFAGDAGSGSAGSGADTGTGAETTSSPSQDTSTGGGVQDTSTGGGVVQDAGSALVDAGTVSDASVASTDIGQTVTDAAVVVDAGKTSLCVPGATNLCYCTPTLKGIQICKDDASGWGPCKCVEPPKDVGQPDAGASPDTSSTVADAGGGSAGPKCLDRAKDIYVLSKNKVLLRFKPNEKKFIIVGTLGCAFKPGHTPFSMSVDRNAVAWVLDQPLGSGPGTLFKVSTLDASCSATTFVPGQAGFQLFGMGFSADGPGTTKETLFVTGGSSSLFSGLSNDKAMLASIAMPSLKLSWLSNLTIGPGSPELTGNAAGQLWGFFPDTSPPSVRLINKKTGASGKVYTLPASSLNGVNAWAFAYWGGDFYLFVKTMFQPSSSVYRLDGINGTFTEPMKATGYTIVGAGVSICAPTQ